MSTISPPPPVSSQQASLIPLPVKPKDDTADANKVPDAAAPSPKLLDQTV